MAAVTPVTANKCVGSNADDTPNIKFYCYTGDDEDGDPIYTCATMRKFKANCPKTNLQCSTASEAWVPAITVCNQRLS